MSRLGTTLALFLYIQFHYAGYRHAAFDLSFICSVHTPLLAAKKIASPFISSC